MPGSPTFKPRQSPIKTESSRRALLFGGPKPGAGRSRPRTASTSNRDLNPGGRGVVQPLLLIASSYARLIKCAPAVADRIQRRTHHTILDTILGFSARSRRHRREVDTI